MSFKRDGDDAGQLAVLQVSPPTPARFPSGSLWQTGGGGEAAFPP